MYENSQFQSPWVRIKNISPLVWGFALLLIAGFLVMIPFLQTFFRTFAVLPLVIGILLLYQAIYRNKY